MNKRLKYAKLRLTSPDDRAAAPLVVKEDQKGSENVDTGENIKGSCKTSKFFTTESSSQNTFIETDDEQSDDYNKESNVHNSRRRSVSEHEIYSGDGPKMPKLRKKISKESGVISNLLNTYEREDEEQSDDHNKESNVHNSQRSTVSEREVCSGDGLKMPKFRKNISNESGVNSHFLNPNKPENDDFEETRQRAVAKPKQTQVKRAVKKTKGPNKPKNQSDIRNLFKKYKSDYDVLHKLIEDHSVSEQIDPEQLQMALAMSRSLVDQKCSSSASSSTEVPTSSGSCSITAEERRIVGIRTTLEQFGFRCKNSYTDYDLNVIFGAGCKNVKKIKHKRATNLQRRTRKELADFIDRQTSTIFPVEMITLCSRTNVLYPSVNLQSYLSNLFWMAQTEQTSNKLFFKYYVPELLEVNPAPVGCLLKDWSKIPGREKTPERNSCARITDLNSSLTQDCSLNRCARPTSPDLFDEFEDSASNANFCHNGTGTINQFERIEKDKVSENEDLVDNGQLKNPVKQSRNALFAPSEEPSSEETLAENKSVSNTLMGESAVGIRKELQKKQENNRRLCKGSYLVEELNESKVENCANARIKEANVSNRSTVGNEDDESPELASPSVEVPALHRSAENMFDETDIEPIVSFEVYSSEQEKTHSEQFFNPHMSEQSFNGCISKVIAEPPKDTTTKVNAGLVGLQPLEDEKELSFNRIAVKARINEALQNSALRVETVDLVDCTATNSETKEDVVIKEGKSSFNCTEISRQRVISETKDDVLYISDDEVNYSIRELSRVPVDAEDDLNRTEIYDCLEPRTHDEAEENEVSLLSYCHQSMETGRLLGTSAEGMSSYKNDSESGADKSSVNCAESTFAYLENLTKQYDLPPLQLRQTGNIGFVKSSILEYSKSDSPPPRTQKSVDQSAPDKCNFALSTSDEGNRLEKNKISCLKDNNIEAEIIASKEQTDIKRTKFHQNSSSKLCSTAKSCCQPISNKKVSNCTNTMASDSGTLLCSEDTKAMRFESMFHELKTMGPPKACPEYLISVKHIDFVPPYFEHMTTSEIERELFKYGLKDLKRSKAIKVLNHLFEKTHMFVNVQEIVKHNIVNVKGCKKIQKTAKGSYTHPSSSPLATTSLLSEHYDQRRICAFKLDLNTDDLYLPLKPRKKIAWCAVPLHITFFNLVSESVGLQRQILLYQPVNLDEIYSVLKEVGLRYETKDLIAFLDKRCITFRCTSSNGDRTKPNE